MNSAAPSPHALSTFVGVDGLRRFLDPRSAPWTPVVELPEILNPFLPSGVRIFLKLLSHSPLGNSKSFPAHFMLSEAQERGALKHKTQLVESSSGNTVASLGVLARHFDIKQTHAYVSSEVTEDKLRFLQFLGIKPTVHVEPICPDPNDPESGIVRARAAGTRHDWFNPGQYENESNPKAHEQITGPQLYAQLDGRVDVCCAGLGTTGTLVGLSRYLRSVNVNTISIGVTRTINNAVPGVRTENLLEPIAFDWREACDHRLAVETAHAYKTSLALCRHGLLVGPSSGLAIAGLCEWLSKKSKVELHTLVADHGGELRCACICPDGPALYINEYFRVLGDQDFPSIENPELLPWFRTKDTQIAVSQSPHAGSQPALPQPDERMAIEIEPHALLSRLTESSPLAPMQSIEIFDIRSQRAFDEAHIEHSVYRPNRESVVESVALDPARFKNSIIILVCEVGVRSRVLAHQLRTQGIQAYSLKGGFAAWSARGLPRCRHEVCRKHL